MSGICGIFFEAAKQDVLMSPPILKPKNIVKGVLKGNACLLSGAFAFYGYTKLLDKFNLK